MAENDEWYDNDHRAPWNIWGCHFTVSEADNFKGVAEYLFLSLFMPLVAFLWVLFAMITIFKRFAENIIRCARDNNYERWWEDLVNFLVYSALSGYWIFFFALFYPVLLGITLVAIVPYRLFKALYIFINVCRQRYGAKTYAFESVLVSR